MQLTYGNQTIDLFSKILFPNTPQKICMSLSGGADSASLLYLICSNFPEIEVFPFTSRDEDAPNDSLSAMIVCEYFIENYPQVHDLRIFDVKTTDPDWIKKAKEEREKPSAKEIVNGVEQFKWRTVKGTSKALQNRQTRYIMNSEHNTTIVTGLTCNPPVQDMIDLECYDIAEKNRNPKQNPDIKMELDELTYKPYLHVDKKFVADVYRQHDLMNELFAHTTSCAWTLADGNKNYPNPCKKCFWCKERFWAFGVY